MFEIKCLFLLEAPDIFFPAIVSVLFGEADILCLIKVL